MFGRFFNDKGKNDRAYTLCEKLREIRVRRTMRERQNERNIYIYPSVVGNQRKTSTESSICGDKCILSSV